MKFAAAIAISLFLAAPVSAMDLQPFRTPSDNIHCLFIADDDGQSSVECELRSRNNDEPLLPVPADCDLDWGSRFALDAEGQAGMVCHGDTLISPDVPVVGYGRKSAFNGITCASEKSGLTCSNGQGHGFSLSRAKQRLF